MYKPQSCRGSIGYMLNDFPTGFNGFMDLYGRCTHIAGIEYGTARGISDIVTSCFLFVSSNKS